MDNVEYLQSITSEDSNIKRQTSLELKPSPVPKEMIVGFEKLITAFNIQKDILQKGKISYYVAESMFMTMESFTELTQIHHGINIYDVRSTTKEPSLINYKNFSQIASSSIVDAATQMVNSLVEINNKNVTVLQYLNSENVSDKLTSAISVILDKYISHIEDIEKFISQLKYNVRESDGTEALLTYDEINHNNIDPSNILGDLSARFYQAQYKFHQVIKQPKFLDFLQDILTVTRQLNSTIESNVETQNLEQNNLIEFIQPDRVNIAIFINVFKTLLKNGNTNFNDLSNGIYSFYEIIDSLRTTLKKCNEDVNHYAKDECIIIDKANQLYSSLCRTYSIYFDILQAYVRLYRNLTVSNDKDNMFFQIVEAIDQFHKDLFD